MPDVIQVLPMGYAQCLRWDGTLGTLSVKLAVHVWVQRHVEFMERERRKLLVVADDKDVAEVAAFGLRMYEGWEPVIATSPAEAIEIASTGAFVGIAVIIVQPSARVPRNIAKLLTLSQEIEVPLFGITPDPAIGEQFTLLGVNVYCIPFDPIHMWNQVPQTAGFSLSD